MKHSFAKFVVPAVLAAGLATGVSADTWKFASEEDKGDVQDIFAQAFADSIKEQSDGDIKVRIYYYGQLGTENDIVELTSKGTVQFVSVGTGHLGSYVPEAQVLDLPYVLGGDVDVIRNVLTTSPTIYEDLSPKFEKVNLKLLTMISEGEMAWGANKPLRTPADFEGQKIRTFTSTIPVETFKAFGANPTPLSWGEVYGALQLKTVDGMVNPVYFIYNAKWHEVQDYLMFPGQQPYVGTVSTNIEWFNSLPAEEQEMVTKAIAVAEQAAHDYQLEINATNMEKIKAERPDLQVIVLTDEERAVFEQLSTTLHETFYDVVEKAYPAAEKDTAREGARTILQGLLSEVAANS
ncbi:C4-dicarboxylate ABC transporter [Meridianimarinicoccus roseus]|jgi:tripartite ATP-independent transporter DctP family solute receptor|uniref:C4-dicarboxylate ABC transporter n=1 Tax=Meridianimarinicoccus roseus TaxID=2072018 RepID=A0A2V2L5S5_9RHOB|nr:TRAP transporter substrate-binding protein DctP [Meridianimarinicoccus roseus]PWR00762.1 C4-dicarboxylate ABC transporter [Meridianimarinicoccus roseus]